MWYISYDAYLLGDMSRDGGCELGGTGYAPRRGSERLLTYVGSTDGVLRTLLSCVLLSQFREEAR